MVNMTLFQIQLLAAIRLDVNVATHIVNLCGAIVQMEPSRHGTGGVTMNVREKLVELLTEFYGCDPMYYDVDALAIAQHLIAHGVTVQEWISVDDRQPNNKGCYLLTVKHWFDGEPVVREACWNGKDWFSCDDRRYKITPRVTHWMPLPNQPKGGMQ